MAPEIVKKIPYQPHLADIWALGILLYVILTAKFPFRGSTEMELYQNIARAKFEMIDPRINPLVKGLLLKFL